MERGKHTPAYKIFNYYWECIIPQHHLYSKDYIKTFGVPTSGNKEMDRVFANSNCNARLTIAEMAIVFDNGANITLKHQEQSADIYQIIIDHLVSWRKQVTDSQGRIDVPLDDLEKLDRLAAEVFKIAKYYKKDNFEASNFLRKIQKIKNAVPVTRDERNKEEERKAIHESVHKPISDSIAKETFSSRWRPRGK